MNNLEACGRAADLQKTLTQIFFREKPGEALAPGHHWLWRFSQ